jgi:hypothetical protein
VTVEILSRAAGHNPAPVTAAQNKCRLLHRRKHDDAIRLVQQIAGNTFVRRSQNFFQHVVGIAQPLLLFVSGKNWKAEQDSHCNSQETFHVLS